VVVVVVFAVAVIVAAADIVSLLEYLFSFRSDCVEHCTEEFTARIMHSVLKGLEYLHDANICHRDMKAEVPRFSFYHYALIAYL
jgi:hypothetical protein